MLYAVENLDIYNIEFGGVTAKDFIIFSNLSIDSNPNHKISSTENDHTVGATTKFLQHRNHNAIANFQI